jgi:ATP phosphoribosyltransferase
MPETLILGVPSKGRLMEDTLEIFRKAGLAIEKSGDERGYRGKIAARDEISVEFLSAGEIARHLQSGRIHLGVTGEDLVREQIPDAEGRVDILLKLGFGRADVVVAIPDCWLDVETMSDLEEAGALFAATHGRRLRVATKYPMLTRRFFGAKGVVSYRTVESLGATEGTPAAGTAEAIVDITSTGSTLKANGLRILSDGLILKSEANLVLSKGPSHDGAISRTAGTIAQRVAQVL